MWEVVKISEALSSLPGASARAPTFEVPLQFMSLAVEGGPVGPRKARVSVWRREAAGGSRPPSLCMSHLPSLASSAVWLVEKSQLVLRYEVSACTVNTGTLTSIPCD